MQINTAQSGFTLIEVLVAMLILAIGLLGIVALQFKGLRYSNDAFMRSEVNFLAYDIADRIRLNRDNADDYLLDYTIPDTSPSGVCDVTAGADAANDLICWQHAAADVLPPSSRLRVRKDSELYSVILDWADREGGTHEIAYSFEL